MTPSSSIYASAKPITTDILPNFRIAKLLDNHVQKGILSMDFDHSGEFLVTSTKNNAFNLYDTINGKLQKTIPSKKYGCDIVRFTHGQNTILHSSSIGGDTIRYLSLHDNVYLRYFHGHQGKITSLEMSPQEDTFISSSLDGTVRLWDLKSKGPSIAQINIVLLNHDPPLVCFDQTGLVFVVALNSNSILLYDSSNYHQGPFSSFSFANVIPPQFQHPWKSIAVSNDGNYILVSTQGSHLYLIDAFNGTLKHILSGHDNSQRVSLKASFTPDSKFVLCGSATGQVYYWSVEDGKSVCKLQGIGNKPIENVLFNPKYMMMASSSDQLAFWIQTLGN